MAYTGFIKPANGIVAAGEPLVQFLKVETATNMKPGRLVKKGSNDDDIVVGTASIENVGWLGYEHAHPGYQPANEDTAYSTSDWVPVLYGGSFVINASVPLGISIIKGDILKGIAAGELTKATAGTDHVVAIAEESTSSLGDVLVRSLI